MAGAPPGRMLGARRAHPLHGAVIDEQRRSRIGAAPPLRAGAIVTSGVVAPLSKSEGYAPSSRLARSQNRRQQNRNLLLNRPLPRASLRLPWAVLYRPFGAWSALIPFRFCRTKRGFPESLPIGITFFNVRFYSITFWRTEIWINQPPPDKNIHRQKQQPIRRRKNNFQENSRRKFIEEHPFLRRSFPTTLIPALTPI